MLNIYGKKFDQNHAHRRKPIVGVSPNDGVYPLFYLR